MELKLITFFYLTGNPFKTDAVYQITKLLSRKSLGKGDYISNIDELMLMKNERIGKKLELNFQFSGKMEKLEMDFQF